MAAVLTAELGNSEKVAHFIAECTAMGVTVLGPDINESRENFTPVLEATGGMTNDQLPMTNGKTSESSDPLVNDHSVTGHSTPPSLGKIRFGLAGVKGVGEQAAQKIIEERDKNGPYADFDDLVTRVDGRAINKRVLEHLSKTGAFDYSGASRKKLVDSIDAAIAGAAAQAKDRAAGQFNMLDMLAEPAPVRKAGPKKTTPQETADDFTSSERLQFEKELLGFYVSGHPMNTYTGLAEAIDTFPVSELLNQDDRTEFRLCGISGSIAKRLAKKDNRPWASFTLATKTASVALNMFADAFANYGQNLGENTLVLVQGNIIVGQDGARINVKECYPLDNFVTGIIRRVTWLVHPEHKELPSFLHLLRDTLNKQTGDTRTSIGFVFENRVTATSDASNALGWKLNAARFQELRAHPAVAGVELETKPLELKQDKRWSKRAG